MRELIPNPTNIEQLYDIKYCTKDKTMLNNKTFQEFWKNTAVDTFEDNQVDAEGIEENTMPLPEE